MCRATIYDARNNFSSLVKIAEGGEPVELTRHDKPVAVIISWTEYEKGKKPGFCEWLEDTRKEYADVFADESFEGLVIPKDEPLDEDYKKYIREMWG
ncbi:MAG: type II toxin-antitoxin system Phd/YefM family antitoxin [Treponema sp.]|nr:type II toxin-antitoxin system Phd/YefM family antitoxin [Treponema sp.]